MEYNEGLGKALVLETEGKIKEAIKSYEALAIQFPKEKAVFSRLGQLHFRNGDLKTCIKYFKKALTLCEGDPSCPYDLAVVYYRAGQLENAINYFKNIVFRCVITLSGNVAIYYRIGINKKRTFSF